jgi:hypothetical protein
MSGVKAEDNGAAKTHLNIKIKSQDGDAIEFKVKPSTKFEKVSALQAMLAPCCHQFRDPAC